MRMEARSSSETVGELLYRKTIFSPLKMCLPEVSRASSCSCTVRHFTGSYWLSSRSTCHVSASTMADRDTVSSVNVCIQIPQSDRTRHNDEWPQTARARGLCNMASRTNTISAHNNADYPRLCPNFPAANLHSTDLSRNLLYSCFTFVKVKR